MDALTLVNFLLAGHAKEFLALLHIALSHAETQIYRRERPAMTEIWIMEMVAQICAL
jgi:hypothetical protein